MIDLAQLKHASAGIWPEILGRVCGVSQDILDGKNHPCPKCGGIDRFRMIDKMDGALFCNQCFKDHNGDGIAAVMWLTGLSFPDAVKRIASEAGVECDGHDFIDVVEEMAWRKNVTTDSLVAFGAENATRGKLPVCRVPMYDADMNVTGHLDLAPSPEDFSKGKMTHGSKHGLFVAERPKPGETTCLVEGVKDAAALHGRGILATGLPTCRMDAAFARFFRGVHVVVIPDRDNAGIEGSKETAARLFGVAESVRIAELPADYQESRGADVRDVLQMRDGEAKVREAIKNARPFVAAGQRVSSRIITFVSLSDALEKFLEGIGAECNLVKTGLPGVDDALGGGVVAGEVVIIAGRPSHGKTAVGLQAMDTLARSMPVLMISEEMSVAALAQRMVSGITTLPERDWPTRRGVIEMEVRHHIRDQKPFYIVESCGTVERAIEAIAKAKREHNIGAAAVDYLQMLRGGGTNRYEQVSDVSMRLKQAAVEHGIVLLALCQLNRGVESRQTSCPRMSDLRDSGQIEQDADVILFVEWLYKTSPQTHGEGEYRIIVAKNRNRPIRKSVVSCTFRPEKQRLYATAQLGHEEFAAFGDNQADMDF